MTKQLSRTVYAHHLSTFYKLINLDIFDNNNLAVSDKNSTFVSLNN